MDSWVALILLLAPLALVAVVLGTVMRGGRPRSSHGPSARDETRRAGAGGVQDGADEAGRRAVSRAVGKSGGVYGSGL